MDQSTWKEKRVLIIILILLFNMIFTIPNLFKPFVLDEVTNVEASRAILETGSPVHYEHELAKEHHSLWHPPLYLYILSIFFLIGGVSEVVARLCSYVFFILIFFLLYRIALHVFRSSENKYQIALTALAIFAINPLTIQSFVNVTNEAVVVFFSVLYLYLFLKTLNKIHWETILIQALIFALLLWSKFQTAPFVIAAVGIYWVFARSSKLRKKIFLSGISIPLGVIFFAITWFLYTSFFSFNFWQPVIHNLSPLLSPVGSTSFFNKLVLISWGTKNMIFWATPGFMLLVLYGIYRKGVDYLKFKTLTGAGIYYVYALITMVFFLYVQQSAYGFPRYMQAIMPFFALLCADVIATQEWKFSKNLKRFTGVLIAALALYSFLYLGDPFIPHNIFYTESITIAENLDLYILNNLMGLIYILPLFVAILGLVAMRMEISRAIIFASALFIVVNSVYLIGIQAVADHNTHYAYGQTGIVEAGEYVKANTKKTDLLLTRMDIAYYAERNFYMSYPILPDTPWDTIFQDPTLTHVIVSPSDKIPNMPGEFILDKQIGSFKIYRKK